MKIDLKQFVPYSVAGDTLACIFHLPCRSYIRGRDGASVVVVNFEQAMKEIENHECEASND